MKSISKITAYILIAVGILTMLFAFIAGTLASSRLGMVPRVGMGGFGVALGVIVGGVVFIQGLTLVAFGQGLYLISEIAHAVQEKQPGDNG